MLRKRAIAFSNRECQIFLKHPSLTDKPINWYSLWDLQPEQSSQVRDWAADAVIVGIDRIKRLAQNTP